MSSNSHNSNEQGRPVSERKRAANRANAQRSTGPKTERGKAFSRLNALKHGILSAVLLNSAETEAQCPELSVLDEAVLDQYGRGDVVGHVLSDLVAVYTSRLRKVLEFERNLDRAAKRQYGPEGSMFVHNPEGVELARRYMTSSHNALQRVLAMLEARGPAEAVSPDADLFVEADAGAEVAANPPVSGEDEVAGQVPSGALPETPVSGLVLPDLPNEANNPCVSNADENESNGEPTYSVQ